MRNMDSTTIALIVLGVTALICALGILILKKRGSKKSAPPSDETTPGGFVDSTDMLKRTDPPPVIRMKKEEPPSDAYRSIYSFIPGTDRIVCPNCGVEYNRGAGICAVCGQKLEYSASFPTH